MRRRDIVLVFMIYVMICVGLGFGIGRRLVAQEEAPPEEGPVPPEIVAVPSFTGELPDGTPVIGIVVVPVEKILNRSEAWARFSATAPDLTEPGTP